MPGQTNGQTDGQQTQLNDKLSVLPVAGCTLPVASCPIASCLVPGPCCCCCCPCLCLCPRCGSVFYKPHVSMCSHFPLPLTLSLPLSLLLAHVGVALLCPQSQSLSRLVAGCLCCCLCASAAAATEVAAMAPTCTACCPFMRCPTVQLAATNTVPGPPLPSMSPPLFNSLSFYVAVPSPPLSLPAAFFISTFSF